MDIDIIKNSLVFKGMDTEDIAKALDFLGAEKKYFARKETVFHAGDKVAKMGLVLEGSLTIESTDVWGNTSIFNHVGQGQIFAETYAYLGDEPMLVDAVANDGARVLFLDIMKLDGLEDLNQAWARKILKNLLVLFAYKNLGLSTRSFHTSPKTIRGRVLDYLGHMSIQKNSKSFTIPFNRQQMADYLNVERSALSKELGRMKNEGLIDFRKSSFVLLY